MAAESKSLISGIVAVHTYRTARTRAVDLVGPFEIGLVFALIMVAVWTPPGRVNTISSALAALCLVWFTVRSHYSVGGLGLTQPGSGVVVMLASGAFMVVTIVAVGSVMHSFGPPQPVPWRRAWQYAVWALQQEFILQSFFYVRMESVLGSRRAAWGSALLFSIAHIPSPVLALLSFIGGLLFCEMFRRYRNIYPLGFIHAALGLSIAASLPDNLLHHMRVGLGYLLYRA
jgi:membrane protease YdiL (CAAX protease family)